MQNFKNGKWDTKHIEGVKITYLIYYNILWDSMMTQNVILLLNKCYMKFLEQSSMTILPEDWWRFTIK